MELTKGLRQEPQRIVIYGPEGIGKSTLASQLPDPVFIDVEGSTSDLDVVRALSPSSWRALVDMVAEFARDHHNRQTLVIDTADWAEKLCIEHICASNNLTSLGGQDDFGKSYNLHGIEWCRFLDSLSRVAASGMHVCLLAHAGIRQARQPDVELGYDRWELKMERKTAAATKEWARTVLFLNYKTYVVKEKGELRKRATGGQRRHVRIAHPVLRRQETAEAFPRKCGWNTQQLPSCLGCQGSQSHRKNHRNPNRAKWQAPRRPLSRSPSRNCHLPRQ